MFSHPNETRQFHERPKRQLAIKNNFFSHHRGDDLAVYYSGIIIHFAWPAFPGLLFSWKSIGAFP